MCIILAVIGVVVVAARGYSRLCITKAPGLDDFLVLVALGFVTALAMLVMIGNKDYYSGRHVWDIPPDSFVDSRINVWASLWCYVIGITLIKISILLFYRRLSVKFSQVFLIATWIGIVYNILYFFSFGLTLLLLCHPLHAYWDAFNPVWAATHKFHCAAENVALPVSSALSVVGDFYSTLLPLILVYHLQLPRRQKLALYALFALGFGAVAAGVIRTVLMYNLLNVDYDFTWKLWVTWICAVIELYLALFAASAPSLKPFFRRFFVDSIGSFARGSRRLPDSDARGRAKAGTGTESGTDSYLTSTMESPIGADPSMDVEMVGVAVGHDRAESREHRFLRDTQQEETRHFQLHTSRDGKRLISKQVYKRDDNTSDVSTNTFADQHLRSHSNSTTPTQDWPMTTLVKEPQRNRDII